MKDTMNVGTVTWDFDDPTSVSNTSTKLNPSHVYSDTGTYNVKLVIHYLNTSSKTVYKTLHIEQSPELILNKDTALCKGNAIALHLHGKGYSYLWNNGSVDSNFTIATRGTFWVEASLGKCKRKDSIIVTMYQEPSLGADSILCSGDTIRLKVSGTSTAYLWNNGTTNSYLNIFSAGTYSVHVTNQCGTTNTSQTIKNISCIEEGQWKLEVFNRWGDRVFQSNDYHNELD
jgi:PKD repeat protein